MGGGDNHAQGLVSVVFGSSFDEELRPRGWADGLAVEERSCLLLAYQTCLHLP